MKGVSTTMAKLCAFAVLALILAAQPVFATPKLPSQGQSVGSVIRSIIRHIREFTDISFPPG